MRVRGSTRESQAGVSAGDPRSLPPHLRCPQTPLTGCPLGGAGEGCLAGSGEATEARMSCPPPLGLTLVGGALWVLMPAPAAAFIDPGGNRCSLRPPHNSSSWRQCGPKAGCRSGPRPQPRAAAGCPDACFWRLRPPGSGSMARDYLPGKRPSCCGRKPLELPAPRLLGGRRLLRAKVTQHERASEGSCRELEERVGAALWAERALRLGPQAKRQVCAQNLRNLGCKHAPTPWVNCLAFKKTQFTREQNARNKP